jgi:dipeptidase E
MNPRRLLLLSNSTMFGEPYLGWPGSHVREFLGDLPGKLFFVPFAGVRISYDEYTSKVREAFGGWGYTVVSAHEAADPLAAARSAAGLVVGGGNTFQLLKRLYETGLLDAIRKRAQEGAPFIGWSAGSNVAGLTVRTTNDMPVVQPPSLDALGLVPFQINPHYTELVLQGVNAETRMERLLEFTELNPGVTVVGLPEGTALRVEGASVRLLGTLPATLLVKGREPWKLGPGDDWDFILR